MSLRLLALCADDFGQSPAVDRGILQLASRGRLSEVSCMVNGPAWPSDAAALAALPGVAAGRLRLGLHLNLTEGAPLSADLARHYPTLPGLPMLILRAHLGLLPWPAIEAEIDAQFAAFERAAGRAPDHLDGHQHVHHLPGLRTRLLRRLSGHPRLRMRHTGQVLGPGFAVKRALIAATGGWVTGRRLSAAGRAGNEVLLGVYDFRQIDYGALFRAWLAMLPARGALIFCHPAVAANAAASGGWPDAIADARVRELAYLDSERFEADLRQAGVALDFSPRAPGGG